MEIFHLKWNLLIILIFFIFPLVLPTDPHSQALLSLKSQITDDLNTLADWVLPAPPKNNNNKINACSWSGITCNRNQSIITGINLSMKNLGGFLPGKQFSVFKNELLDLNLSQNAFSGNFPVEIFNLSNLISLDISRNNFSGKFPGGISGLGSLLVFDAFSNSFTGSLPAEISKLESLQVLNLAGSYFSGEIPSEYGNFKNLEFLHLAGNNLNGQIPPELGRIKTMIHMEIGYNTYQGVIPWQFGNLSEIRYLDIAGANLSGSIPKEISNLTKLESLFLFRNQLTGAIPREFSRISSLKSLDLSVNLISGPIPESFSELKNLRLLSLMYNNMNGTVPEGLAMLPSLEVLFIWNNYFTGSLPENLGRNSSLRWIDVSTNNFIGNIPEGICSNGALYKVMLFSNKFTGSLLPSLSNCSSLVRLRLEDNLFSGEIPLKFSQFPGITYIDLSYNNFSGGVPLDIVEASKLEYFNISHNPDLGGIIPPETWSLPKLQNFSAFGCNISGSLPPFKSCKSVSVMELQSNNLSGTIPETIATCQALERVDLANNKLTGHIPVEIANLPALSLLDLSHNNLSGRIPSGEVFKLMGSEAYIGNHYLCGEPLRRCGSSMEILGSKGGAGKLILAVVISVGVVMFIAIAVMGVFLFRRGKKGQYKMVSFPGLPGFTANDVLKSFNSTDSICKVVLPTGITVSVKKMEWEVRKMRTVLAIVTQMGKIRHKNVVRLLGFCYNKDMGYLLYDYLPNGSLAEKIRAKKDWVWAEKYKIVIGIAKGLCFLHHECYPAIPHGDLKLSNVVFDENMEPHLAEFGFKSLIELSNGSASETTMRQQSDEYNNNVGEEELHLDVCCFGEVVLEILTNGRLTNRGDNIKSKPREALLREIYSENEVVSTSSLQEEIKLVLDVALFCMRNSPSDRPSMEDALKLLSGVKTRRK